MNCRIAGLQECRSAKNFAYCLFLIFLAISTPSAQIQPPAQERPQTRLTLRQAVSLATGRDPRLLEAHAKEQRAVREAALGHARFGPSVFTGTGALYTYGLPQTPGGGPPPVFNLAFTETLYDGPARGREHAADRRVDVERLGATQVRTSVIAETATTYLELAGVRQALNRLDLTRDSAQRIVDLTLEQLKEARVLPVDVLQARLTAAQVGRRVSQLQSRELSLEGTLAVLTGVGAGGVRVGRYELDDQDQPSGLAWLPSLPERSVEELVAVASAYNPALKAAELEERAREDTLAGERGGYWPSIEIVGNYAVFARFNNLDVFFTRFQRNNINVGIEARVPIFRSETTATVALARSQVSEASAAVRRVRDQIELDVRQAAGQVREAAASRSVAEIELAIAQEKVRLAQTRMTEGRASRLELEKALVEEGQAWDGFYQAAFTRQRAELQLRQITGELDRIF